MTEGCSRCEAEFKESEIIQRIPTRHGVKSGDARNFCGLCFLASEVLRFTRSPITEEEDMAVHPVRVYSRALAKAVRHRNGKENELKGAYDGLITENVREHAPEWMQEQLGEAEKAMQGRLPSFDKRDPDDDEDQTQLNLKQKGGDQ